MDEPFVGSEAIASGALTRHALRRGFVAVHHDIYVGRGTTLTAVVRAKACWLRSRRRGVLAGYSAAAVHGARWIDARDATVIDTNRRRTAGIKAWAESLQDDEICVVDGMRVTTAERTALDIASRYPADAAIAAIDSLARATRLDIAGVERLVARYRGRPGIRNARAAMKLVDGGAESPRETWLRLLLVRNGFPRPRTQIAVYNEFGALIAELDMGWEDIKVAAEYDGDQHRTDSRQFNRDIRRLEDLREAGWIVVRITAQDTDAVALRRIRAAFDRRT